MRQVQNVGHRSQVTDHRSHFTENAIKKLDTLLGFLCLFICFISGYVTIRHMFGIDHASCCSESKRTKRRKLHMVLELEEQNVKMSVMSKCQIALKKTYFH